MDSPKRKSPALSDKSNRASHQYQHRHDNPIEAILSRLERVKETGPNTWVASCPTSTHGQGDRSRGLSIREGDDGRVLIHCHAGCGVDEIVNAIGLELHDLFPQREITYPHHAPRGSLIGRPRIRRIPWPDLWEALEVDLTACSLAFSRLAAGQQFTTEDALSISAMAGRVAAKISEVRHGRG